MAIPDEMQPLWKEVETFLRRDPVADVRHLNEQLRKLSCATAGLEEAPPSVLTGDPFALTPGLCIAVLGLNPKWQAGGREAPRAQHDLIPNEDDLRNGRLDAYRRRRANYFAAGDPQYYGRYFTRLGNRIARVLLRGASPDARDVFTRFAFKLDLLPWWSTSTDCIDSARLRTNLEPLLAWKAVLRAFFETLQPAMIVVNGSGFRGLLSAYLGVELTPFSYGSERLAYYGREPGMDIPILVHAQAGAQGGPGDDNTYERLIAAWEHNSGCIRPNFINYPHAPADARTVHNVL